MQILVRAWPMPATARARPRMGTNQRAIETLTTMERISESTGLARSQRTSAKGVKTRAWPRQLKPAPENKRARTRNRHEVARLADAYEAGSGDQAAHRHQPAAAVAVDQRADHRRGGGADQNLAGADQRKSAARDAEIGGQRFQKYRE